jgi:hypothetical protein
VNTSPARPDYCPLNPACQEEFEQLERRVDALEKELRGEAGIFATLKRLEIELVKLTTSVRVTVAIGSAAGALVGALASAASIAALFLRR